MYVVMIHLSEQAKLIELETEQVLSCVRQLQVIVKSHGQHTYLQETRNSSKPELYANAPLSFQVLCFCLGVQISLGHLFGQKYYQNIIKIKQSFVGPLAQYTLKRSYKWPPTLFCACLESKHRSHKLLIP